MTNKIKEVFYRLLKYRINKKLYTEETDFELNDKSSMDDYVVYTNALCDQVIRTSNHYKNISDEYRQNCEIIKILDTIEKFDKKLKSKFEKLLVELSNSKKEREELQKRIKTPNPEVLKMEGIEEKIPSIINDIEKAEEKQRIAKSDMNYLEGEKEYLLYQKQRLEKATKAVGIINIIVATIFAISMLILVTIYTIYEKEIIMPGIILFGVALFSGLWIYIFRRFCRHELILNGKKQKRAVVLLNKAKLKYVRHTRFLEYVYKKHGVISSNSLRENWSLYTGYKMEIQKYKRVARHAGGIVDEFEKIVEKNDITGSNYIIDNLMLFKTKGQRNILYKEVTEKIKNAKITIQNIEKEQKEILGNLNEIRLKEDIDTTIIEKIIDSKFQNTK